MTVSDGVSPSPKGGGAAEPYWPPVNPPWYFPLFNMYVFYINNSISFSIIRQTFPLVITPFYFILTRM